MVTKVEFHFGELFPRVGVYRDQLRDFKPGVVRFYNKRDMAEQWIKEGKQAVAMTRLSCHHFRANQVRLRLSVVTYNLGYLWRRLALPARVANCSRHASYGTNILDAFVALAAPNRKRSER